MSTQTLPQGKKSMLIPIIIIAGLFATLGFCTWVNGALIPYMQSICELTAAEAYLVASASYISFCIMALPSSFVLQKIGYKKGMSLGLLLMAVGTLIFVPAASSRTYLVFLSGIFITGTGMTLLQTAVNPYITILGPIESAAKRISIMGICNKLAGAIGSVILGALLLSGIKEKNEILSKVSAEQKESILKEMANGVVTPYIVLTIVLVLLSLFILKAPLPNVEAPEEETASEGKNKKTSIFQFPHLWLGVLTLFAYVGAEVIAGDSIISYGIRLGFEDAKFFTSLTLGAMITTYLTGVILIPKYISQETALRISAMLGIIFSVCIIFTTGFTSVLFVATLGIANALVWPAVWPLALEGLGKFTKTASALLVMGISGGAIIPPLYGRLIDMEEHSLVSQKVENAHALAATNSYWILIPCYAVILYFAFWGHKVGHKSKA